MYSVNIFIFRIKFRLNEGNPFEWTTRIVERIDSVVKTVEFHQ